MTTVAKKVTVGVPVQLEKREMDAVVARLCREKAVRAKKYFANGAEDGLVWAKRASYDELVSWVDTARCAQGVCAELPDEVIDCILDLHEDTPGFDHHSYERGWQYGVLRLWGEVERQAERASCIP